MANGALELFKYNKIPVDDPYGIAVTPDGTAIYIATIANGSRNARILSIDPADATGIQRVVTEGIDLSLVAGLRVFEASGGSGKAAIRRHSPTLLLFHTAAADTVGSGGASTGLSMPPQTSLPRWPAAAFGTSETSGNSGRILQRTMPAVSVWMTAVDSLFADWDDRTAVTAGI